MKENLGKLQLRIYVPRALNVKDVMDWFVCFLYLIRLQVFHVISP